MPLLKPETRFDRCKEDVNQRTLISLVAKSKVKCIVYANVDEQPFLDLHQSSALEKVKAQRIRNPEDRKAGS